MEQDRSPTSRGWHRGGLRERRSITIRAGAEFGNTTGGTSEYGDYLFHIIEAPVFTDVFFPNRLRDNDWIGVVSFSSRS